MIRMTILNMDPPKHSRYRRLVSAGFTPRMIGRLIDNMQARATAIVANVEGREAIEFVEEVAAELPPPDDLRDDRRARRRAAPDLRLEQLLVGIQDEDFRTSEEDGQMAAAEIYGFCEEIAADRRENGRDDIMTALVNAEVDGDRLRQHEINMFFVTLALLQQSDIKADLVANIDDDTLWSSATEEFLRWGSSIHNFRRSATLPSSNPRTSSTRAARRTSTSPSAAVARTSASAPTSLGGRSR